MGSLYPRLTDCTGVEQVFDYSKVKCCVQPAPESNRVREYTDMARPTQPGLLAR